ncbi:MAG: hypothetical protein LQ338_006765 [Usnochroma carphineum]|nr:MAG: hypothetical protein LQ338_006765 [Usnochroma carphineum]
MGERDTAGFKTPTPLWLDCHDDAFAILLAAHHPRLKLLGVSTVHGNASLAHTTANAGSILTAVGAQHIPYYAGAAKPLCREAVHAPNIHGASGLDGTSLLPEASVPPVKDGNAILAMRNALLGQPASRPWLVATGALTNIALLFATFPEAAEHIAGLSIMGGAIGDGFTDAPLGHVKGEGQRIGNHTPWAEFNIYCDPEAAQSVFSNPVLAPKTTLIPLDLTHTVLATKAVQENLLYGSSDARGKGASNVRKVFHDLLVFYAHTYADVFGISAGPPLHDPLAVAVVLFDIGAEELAFDDRDGERFNVEIVTDGKHSDWDAERGQVGRTMIWESNGPKVRIPHGLDVGRFWDVIEECLQRVDRLLALKN